jgi:sporulation protein YlmC with PRC-barrel domain
MVSLDSDDEGKRVVDSDGVEVGVVVEVDDDTTYVDPDPNVLEEIGSRFGLSDADEETFPISDSDVQAVTDDEIRLNEWTDPSE